MTPKLTDEASALTVIRCRPTTSSYNLNQVVRRTNWKVESFSVAQHKEMTHTSLDFKGATQIKLLHCPSGRWWNSFKPQKCRQEFVNYIIQMLKES